LDIDYIGLGAYRPTNTKNVTSIGGETLLEIAKLSTHPVAIIGGVRLDDNIPNIKYKVIGSDICKLTSIQLKKKRISKKKLKNL
jgi:thiamine-phosphate pyrophosphorylase